MMSQGGEIESPVAEGRIRQTRYQQTEQLIFDAIGNLDPQYSSVLPHGRKRFDVIRSGYKLTAVLARTSAEHVLDITKKPINLDLPHEREHVTLLTSVSQSDETKHIGRVARFASVLYTRRTLGGQDLDYIASWMRDRDFKGALAKSRVLVDSLASTLGSQEIAS